MKIGVQYFISLTLLCVMYGRFASAQDKPSPFQARNAIYLELGGSNRLYSLNYDQIVAGSFHQHWLFGYRVGGSLAGLNLVGSRLVGELYALLGQRKSHLELGLSSSLGLNVYDSTPHGGAINTILSPVVAYRLQEPKGPSCFRVSVGPFWTLNSQDSNRSRGIFVGLSFGRSF